MAKLFSLAAKQREHAPTGPGGDTAAVAKQFFDRRCGYCGDGFSGDRSAEHKPRPVDDGKEQRRNRAGPFSA